MNITNKLLKKQSGNSILGVLFIMVIGLIITAGMLRTSASTLSTRRVIESNTENFFEVEKTINAVAAWLQQNSKNIVTAFTSANFSSNFDLGDPVAGDNEGTAFAVPTMLKMSGTNNAVQLTNSSYFGSSSFPATTNIETSASFDATTAFAGADFGTNVAVRLLVVWALETDGNYQPIFRVDAITGNGDPEHGVHGINFIKSALVTSDTGIGYYADDGDFQTQTSNNECWSYQYSWNTATSTWSRGAPRSNCLITGQDDIQIKSAIHGSVMTNKYHGINLDGGSISGTKCEGAGCVSYTLPALDEWAVSCAGQPIRDITATGDDGSPTDLTSGPTRAEQCYRTVTVPSNKTIKFVTANQPYYIKSLNLQNNSNSRMRFETFGPGNKFTMYVDSFSGNKINGNQMISTNLAPNQVEVNLPKAGTLTLNGTASMNGVFIGNLDHTIKHSGNFTFYGALRSNAVEVTGNALLGYDEGLGGSPALTDINFTLYKASQRYR